MTKTAIILTLKVTIALTLRNGNDNTRDISSKFIIN